MDDGCKQTSQRVQLLSSERWGGPEQARLTSGGASKNFKGGGRPREGEPLAIAMTATARARGGVPASVRHA